MLRISIVENPGALWLVLEGRLVGPWVDELQRVCDDRSHAGASLAITVDLSGLTAMDTQGQKLLDRLLQGGATLRGADVMNQYLVEQMAQPAGGVEEACRPCRRTPSHSDAQPSAIESLAS